MDLMDEELRRVLAGTAEPTRRREEVPPTAAELAAASSPSFRMSSPGRRAPEQRGGGEALETIGSAVLSSIPAGLTGLGYLATGQGPQKAAEAVQRVQDALALDPETEGGVRAIRGISEAFSPLGVIPQAAGEATLRATGSPLLATGAELLADPLNLLGAGAAARPAARAAAAAGRGAAKAGKATVQSLGPKAAEMAEAYMRRAGMMPDIFIGKSAKTWDAASNVRAVEMEKAGADPRDIWSQTGNWRAPDGQWRQEISDVEARFTPDPQAKTVAEVLSHPELFRAYPELQSMRMTVDPTGQSAYSAGFGVLPEEITLGRRATKKTALHEAQHPIQEREGFGAGANPNMFEYKFEQTPEQRAAFNAFANLSAKLGGPADLKPSDISLSGDVYEFTQSIIDGLDFNTRLPKSEWEDLRQSAKAAGLEPPKSQEQLWMLGEDVTGALNRETSKAELTPTQQYLRTPGEAEARAVEARAGMTAEQRRATFPEESYDVPISELRDVERQEPTTALATVYHGSPHIFPAEEGLPLGRFRSEKIGTGEGHQAYGVGTYTAEEPAVATGYRERLTGRNPNVFLLGGKDVSIVGGSPEWKTFSDAAKSQGYSQESAALAYQTLKDKKGDLDAASGELTWRDDATKIHDEAASLLRDMQYKPEGGALYTVDLPDPIVDKMLDWDKPLGQQSPDIQKAAQRIAANLDPEARKLIGDSLMNLKGSKLYELLASDDSVAGAGQFGAAASAIMREHGIPGIKYLDEGSRGNFRVQNKYKGENYGTPVSFKTEDQARNYMKEMKEKGWLETEMLPGTRNFVVFPGEEKNLTILQRNERRLDAEIYKEKLLATLPHMMRVFEKNFKGWSPSKKEMLDSVETGYNVMNQTGDVKQAGKAVMDELNALYRLNQEKGVLQRNEQRLPQTDTPAFKEFTGGAPVIKADQASKAEFQTGKPVVIEGYHGTRRDFTAVDPAQASSGYFASSKPLVADEYAGVYPEGMGGGSFPTGGNVQKTYMRMDNPLVVNARGASFNRVDTRGIPGFGLPMSNTDMINHWAKQQGYDGVIYKDLRDSVARPTGQNTPASNVYVAFKPNYVKSAIGNRGTFDVGTTDMTKAQGGAVGGNMSYTQAADVIAGKLVGQGVDPDRAMTMALRMSDAHMKAGGAVLMNDGGDVTKRIERMARERVQGVLSRPEPMRKTWDGPLPNRPVVNGRAMVSAEELADFRRQFGAQMTLRDLLNADKGMGPSATNPAARGVQGANIAPRGPRVRPDEAATLPAAGAADIPGLIMQGMEQGAERVPAGRGAGAAFVGAGLPRAMTGAKLLREHPSISPERRQMLKEMEDYISGLNKERIEPTFAAGGAAKAGKAISSALQAARDEARAVQAAQRAAEQAQRLSEMSPMQRNAHEVSQALAEQKTPITVKPDTVQRMMEERAAQIMQANPKLTEEAVAARARRDATRQLKWERQGRERLQKRYGELSPSRYDMPAQRKLRNLPGAVEERAEKAREFLSRPTPPWEPPNAELQAFDRNLIKDALEGFPGIEQTRFPRYEAPRAQTGYIDEIYDDPRNRELIKQQIKRGLPLGGETFYASLYPVKVAAMERGIPAEKFDRFIYETAPASARNSIMNEMAVGQFMRDMKARGLPLDEQTVKEEMARFKQRYGIGLPLMPVHREGVRTMIESGANMRDLLKADIPTNYKIPTYGTQKAGDFGKSMVLDVHEAAGQTQGSRFHPYFTEQGGFGPTEYGLAEGKMLDIAKEMGIPGGMAQAGRWFGGGELTGLKSPRGDALDLLEKQTAYTLQGQGINPTPKVVRDYILNMVESGEGVLMPYFKSKPMPDYRTKKAEGGAVSKEEDNDPSMALIAEILLDMAKKQGKKEAKSLGQPRATTDLLNRGVVAPLAGMPVDLVNMGLEGVDAIRSLFGPVHTKLASKKPFLGSEYLKDLMDEYNMTSGEERPMMETGLSIFSPGAAIRSAAGAAESLPRAARAAESGLNRATAAATRPFVPATVTMEAVAPDLAKFKPRQWQETATRRLTGPGAPVSMDVMGGQRTTKRPGQGVYENFAGDLETNPLVAIDVPRAGNLSTNTPLRRDIAQAGSDLAQESVAAHRFVPMMTNQIKDASAMLIKPKGGSLSNEQVIEMAKSLPGMIVAHNPRLGGVVVMPFDYQPGKIPPEFRDANQVARKVLGDKAAITYGKADPVKDRLYIERGEYAGEGIGLPSAETTKMRQRLQRAEQRLFAPRQPAAVSPP